MTKQPEALKLADILEMRETYGADASLDLDAMDELRRLHEVNEELLEALKNLIVRYQGKKQGVWGESTPEMLSARAAVLKATGETEDHFADAGKPMQPEHPEQMARLGWQYVECPACGSEGARAFPKPEQEPVAWLQIGVGPLHEGDVIARTTKPKEWNPEWWKFEPLYTSPPHRQPLTDEEKLMCWSRATCDADVEHKTEHQCLMDYGSEIEAKHGIGDKT